MAVRLRDDGLADHVIAVALDIEDDQVPTLLQIADSKLNSLMALEDTSLTRTERIGRSHLKQTRQSQGLGGSS
ncbi:MAG: hypothetical protein ACLPQS_02725 [Acidimicrobiales bacterium]